jgi:D-glycerate 3-kinase
MNPIARVLLPWCRRRLEARSQPRAWVLGLQGPQGCGKSTAAGALIDGARREGLRAVAVSIDDFYLAREQQLALAQRHAGNPYLLHRGYPGTHDVALGAQAIEALASCVDGSDVLLPVYDKSAHGGRGDRAPASCWTRVAGPLDFVIVEGWMLGFTPVDEAMLEPDLVTPNRYLAAYRAWNAQLDALVHLTVGSLATIVEWRVESERARRLRGETALSDEDATDYIHRFLPAYRVYVPAMEAEPPCADFRVIALDPNREPIPASYA